MDGAPLREGALIYWVFVGALMSAVLVMLLMSGREGRVKRDQEWEDAWTDLGKRFKEFRYR